MILWPVLATFGNGAQRSGCKVFASDTGTDLWAWNPDTKKAEVLAHSDRLPTEIETSVWILDVDDGTEVRMVVDARDCGCSHPLKYFRPAPGADRVYVG